MSLLGRFLQVVTSPLRAVWVFVWNRLDDRLKRMCLMASLHAALLQCNEHEHARIAKLNSSMDLIRGDLEDALRLPTLFGKYVWRGILPIEKVDLNSEKYVQRIVRMTPCWLTYTDESNFIDELKQLFSFCAHERTLAT